jgi:late competence protein required for DNA uptake (superfamily II DNA/RNA helicase)
MFVTTMPTDSYGVEYSELDDDMIESDTEQLVYVPVLDENRVLSQPNLGDDRVTTIDTADYSCPMCDEEQPSLKWIAPSAAFSCAECGYLSLGTREVL